MQWTQYWCNRGRAATTTLLAIITIPSRHSTKQTTSTRCLRSTMFNAVAVSSWLVLPLTVVSGFGMTQQQVPSSLLLSSSQTMRTTTTMQDRRFSFLLHSSNSNDNETGTKQVKSDAFKDQRDDPFKASDGLFSMYTAPIAATLPASAVTARSRSSRPPSSKSKAKTPTQEDQNGQVVSSLNSNEDHASLIRPLGGGPSMVFEMARKCLLDWNFDAPEPTKAIYDDETPLKPPPVPRVLPRWHPHKGISNANPNFRTEAPVMNNQGFARSIWRNARKRNKPSLWKQALRTYDRMLDQPSERLQIQQSNVHHEGAMMACSKLGDWKRAFQIYETVYQVEQEQKRQRQEQLQQLASLNPSTRASTPRMAQRVSVTENMIYSLLKACVKASRKKSGEIVEITDVINSTTDERQHARVLLQRRRPLDKMVQILQTIDERHKIPVVARHVNPIASAYINLGYLTDARHILQTLLTNRTAGDEPEDGEDIFNIYDVCAKDKGSYGLLVSSAVSSGDWEHAVEALAEMTEAGLFPKSRQCNAWYEISERHTRPRAVRSWKKKRDDYWVESM